MFSQKEYIKIRKSLNFSRSAYNLGLHIGFDTLLLLITYNMFNSSSIVAHIFSQILFAIFCFRSFGIMHEAVHNNLWGGKKANTLMGVFYGSFCFLPYLNWRSIHIQHHRWAGNVDKDPTMSIVSNYPKLTDNKKIFLNKVWALWLPYLALLQNIVFWKASIAYVSKTDGDSYDYKYLASLVPPMIFAGLVIMASFTTPYLTGLIPGVLIYLVMVEVVNFPHHLEMEYIHDNERLHLKDQYKVSRSTIYNLFVGRFVFLNFNYHSEHHLYPDLPWHELPEANALLTKHLEGLQTSMGHSWIVAARKKNLQELFCKEPSEKKTELAA